MSGATGYHAIMLISSFELQTFVTQARPRLVHCNSNFVISVEWAKSGSMKYVCAFVFICLYCFSNFCRSFNVKLLGSQCDNQKWVWSDRLEKTITNLNLNMSFIMNDCSAYAVISAFQCQICCYTKHCYLVNERIQLHLL